MGRLVLSEVWLVLVREVWVLLVREVSLLLVKMTIRCCTPGTCWA